MSLELLLLILQIAIAVLQIVVLILAFLIGKALNRLEWRVKMLEEV